MPQKTPNLWDDLARDAAVIGVMIILILLAAPLHC